jgi:fatty-acid peroxygenase
MASMAESVIGNRSLPRDYLPDSSLALALDPYRFISGRRRSLSSDLFACRLMLRRAICIGGPGAARLFYDASCFRRAGVVPSPVRHTLLGEGGVHGLDAADHRHRKAMFLSFMGPACIPAFDAIASRHFQSFASVPRRHIAVLDETRCILFRAVMEWACIPFAEQEVSSRSSDLIAMVDGFGSLGPRHWRGRRARQRSEQWVRKILDHVRTGRLHPQQGSALHTIAFHQERDGAPLDLKVAAVELLNVIRPMMAAAFFVELAAAALLVHPYLKDQLLKDGTALDNFVQEVRRFTPFTPLLGAEACREVEWQGCVIPAGTLTILDVYGIHRDERIWPGAEAFDPGRFAGGEDHTYSLLQQGGGEHAAGHRCAGEWLTIAALKGAARRLATLNYTADVADLSYNLKRVPSRLREPLEITIS